MCACGLSRRTRATCIGAAVMPAVPAFCVRPVPVEQGVGDAVEGALDLLGVEVRDERCWTGCRARTWRGARRGGGNAGTSPAAPAGGNPTAAV
jgi:hypothetical protein